MVARTEFADANFGHGLILNDALPFAPWASPLNRLPGVQPLGDAPLFLQNEAGEKQLAFRNWLYHHKKDQVYAILPEGEIAAAEVANLLGQANFADAALSVQEDLCLLEGQAPFRLMGAFLAFPAGWRLEEKLGRSLLGVHAPIVEYDQALSARVERMLSVLRAEQPLWRANVLRFDHPELHARTTENVHTRSGQGRWLRSERQILKRLPNSGAILFSIHTFLLDLEAHQEIKINFTATID